MPPLPFSGNFAWSADSKKIVYQKIDVPSNSGIYLYSLETGEQVNLTNSPKFEADPCFSPDGKQIIYQAELKNKSGELRIYNIESQQSGNLFDECEWNRAFTVDAKSIGRCFTTFFARRPKACFQQHPRWQLGNLCNGCAVSGVLHSFLAESS